MTNSSSTASTYIGVITFTVAASIVGEAGTIAITGIPLTGTTGITLGGSAGGSISTVIAGARALTKEGSGTWTLSGTNTYTGVTRLTLELSVATTVSAGTVSASSIVVSGSASNLGNASSAVVLGGASTSGTLSYTGAAATYTRGFTVSAGGGGITNTTANVLTIGTGGITNGGALTLSNTSTGGTTISSVISSTGSVTVNNSGTGVTTLSGANTYTGATTVSAGTVSASSIVVSASASNLGNASSAVVLGGASTSGTLSYTGAAATYTRGFTVSAGGGGITNTTANVLTIGTGGITNGGALTLSNTSTGGTTISSIISSSGSVTVNNSGAGATTISGTNTFTGGTTLTAGTLNINSVQALGTVAGTFTINGGTINATTAGITTVNYPQAWNGNFTFTGTQALNLGTGAITLGADCQVTVSASTLTAGGTISGAGFNLTKAGPGALALGANPVTLKGLTIAASGGTLSLTSGAINLAGDFSNSGTFTQGTGLLTFNGSTAQAIGGTTATAFNDVTISNTNAPITANTSFSIASTKTLTVNANAILSPAPAVVVSGLGTLTGNGTVQVTRTTAQGTADFSSQYGITNKTLTSLTVEFVGTTAQSVNALTYGGLKINNSNGVTLAGPATVNNALNVTNGTLTTSTNTITLGPSATLSEAAGQTVLGTITTSRNVTATSGTETFGNIGADVVLHGASLGNTPVTRTTGTAITSGGHNSIKRYFDIAPTNNSNLNADLVFHYDESELNGEAENTLSLYRSNSPFTTWTNQDGIDSTVANKVTATGINDFSRWTAADASNPLGGTGGPTITSISPTSKAAGDAQFTLTVNGTGFVNGQSTVRFDGNGRTTSYVNTTQLTATIPATDLEVAGHHYITVFNAGGGGLSNQDSLTVNPGSATKLAFSQQPANAVAGVNISPAVTVRIEDTFGNLVTGDNTTQVSLAIGTNPPGNGVLTGGSAVTVSGGTATFNSLSIDKVGSGYTLAASSSPSFTVATSNTFDITAAGVSEVRHCRIGFSNGRDSE